MSTNPRNILPFPSAQPTLDEAVASWVEAKRKEDAAKAERLACEQLICELQPPKSEGSTTLEAGEFKLTLTGSMTYKVDDLDAMREITRGWDAAMVPLKSKTEIDPSGCKWLRANRPDLWAELAKVITVAPAKTSIKVGV